MPFTEIKDGVVVVVVVDVEGADAMVDSILLAKKEGYKLQINGDGNCIGVETENIDKLNIQ